MMMQGNLGFKEKEVFLNNSFVYSNFDYRPLVWHFCSSKNFIEKIQERALRLLHNNFVNSDYAELLKIWGKVTMEMKLLRCIALEIFKTVNNLNPYYMKEIFSKTTNLTHRPLDINFNQNNTTKYGSNSLRSLGPHIWNSLPSKIKVETVYKKFKNYMNDWFGLKCKCNMCSFLNV